MRRLSAAVEIVSGGVLSLRATRAPACIQRTSAVLRFECGDGVVGLGEASPLPGYSPDSVEATVEELTRLVEQPVVLDPSVDPWELFGEVAIAYPLRQPSARFAFETALLDWLARSRGMPAHRLLNSKQPGRIVPIADLVVDQDPTTWLYHVDQLLQQEATHLKFKVGSDLAAELRTLHAIRQAHPTLPLRLDGNRRIPLTTFHEHAARIEALDLELLEEPVAASDWNAILGYALPFALDESMRDERLSTMLLQSGHIVAVVLKPTVLGGLSASGKLAALAARHHVKYTTSHTFDGPIARAVTAELTLALDQSLAAGLGEHPSLAFWPPHRIDAICNRQIATHDVPGIGVEFEGGSLCMS